MFDLRIQLVGQSLFNEQEPNDTPEAAATSPQTAPVRLEGSVVGSDIDYYVVDLPAGIVDWSLFVFDTCSLSTCTVNPQVTVFFESDPTTPVYVELCHTSWAGSGRIIIEVRVPASTEGGGYGIVISMSNHFSPAYLQFPTTTVTGMAVVVLRMTVSSLRENPMMSHLKHSPHPR